MEYIHVKNLKDWYVDYKDRTLIWCKAKFTMLNTQKWKSVPEIDKWRFIALVMLELINKEPVCNDPEYLKSQGFDLKKRSMSLTLRMLHTFIEVRNGQSEKCVTQIRIEENKNKKRVEAKKKYLDFVFLTDAEYKKLVDKFGEHRTALLIKRLNLGIGSKGYKYKSHYFTILKWEEDKTKPEDHTCPHCGKQGVKYQMEAGEKVWRCQEYLDQQKSTPAADKVGNPLKQVPQSGPKMPKQAAIRRLKGEK